jgi:hypothetical protein
MAATQVPTNSPGPTARERALADLERGCLVRLLAEVDLGRLDAADLEAAIEAYEKKRWFRRLLVAVLGRRPE